ncbi:MAG: PorV/PorQ family protein [Candidatus Marinimicrobia bacterium]|nr:PorV/PorQ family protein [Candidatus Neomarinimicrobiota bacterium]
MKKLIIILFSITTLFSQSKVGTSAAQFLGIGIGPAAVGMGGATTSLATDASILYWNPGGISRLSTSQVQFAKTNWLVDTEINLFATVIKLDGSNSLGLYLMQLDYGKEEITDLEHQNGNGLYWKASDLVFGLAYARNLTDRFSFGGTGKVIHQQIHNEKSSGVAIDMGLLYNAPDDNYRLGMSISNFLGSDLFMDGKDLYRKIDLDPDAEGHNETIVAKMKTDPWPLPLIFRVGLSSNLIKNETVRFTVATDAIIPSDDVETLNLGTEVAFLERVFIRAGYSNIGNEYSEEGLSVGAGVKVFTSGMSTSIDYTNQNFGMFGNIPHWGINISF